MWCLEISLELQLIYRTWGSIPMEEMAAQRVDSGNPAEVLPFAILPNLHEFLNPIETEVSNFSWRLKYGKYLLTRQ